GFGCAIWSSHALCWGNNLSGVLGLGVPGGGTPVMVPLPNAVQIAAGVNHACALTSQGTAACWGANDQGQLGGSPDRSYTPREVPGLAGVKAVGAGDGFSCAVDTSGSVLCWGRNASGQLGDGSLFAPSNPTAAPIPSPAAAVSLGGGSACALLVAGS